MHNVVVRNRSLAGFYPGPPSVELADVIWMGGHRLGIFIKELTHEVRNGHATLGSTALK